MSQVVPDLPGEFLESDTLGRRQQIRLTTDCGQDILLNRHKTVPMLNGGGLQIDDLNWLTQSRRTAYGNQARGPTSTRTPCVPRG